MLPYWILFLIPAVGVLSQRELAAGSRPLMWGLIGTLFTLVIGLRFEVGGDWGAYLAYLDRAAGMTLPEVLTHGDPGYYLLNWLSAKLGGGIYAVNLVCGAILMSGVIAFARRQPLPWLALLVAVPYLIIVVGMGYTRQAVALGFVLLGLVALGDNRLRAFVIWLLVGAAFHKSAVLLLPIAGLAASQNRFASLAWGTAATLIGGYLFLFDSVDQLWTNYVEADYQSEGGLIRVLMNAVPAVLFLLFHRYMRLSLAQQRLWWWMSLLAIACIPLVMMSSTATDRVALYLIPLQMFVFARLHLIVGDIVYRTYMVAGVMAYYLAAQAVWLFLANHAHAWLPYQVAWLG
ncbi:MULTISPECIES: EpsG family protein [Halomonas]|uniref:EpsG-like putative glucosyltransferase n=1 Tax=Halomonas ventosae TaxID=229007 RepID=A0A4R6I687_9GAMM|nr:EpsG family protein [Halomonas ventosae]TDO16648.1 EpsG-like putative glucosyltransferase [Halomonas ventosae]